MSREAGVVDVLVVDDQQLIRSALMALLDAEPQIHVVGEASNGRDALAFVQSHHPAVVLSDIRMPGMDGLELTRRLRARASPPAVVILTTYGLDEYVFEAIRAGACGFLLKDSDADDLVRGVRLAGMGESFVDPQALRRLLDEFGRRPTPDPIALERVELLSNREQEVLLLMAHGLTNSEISTQLVISEATTKTHVGHVLQKLGARDRVQAVITAYDAGLVRR
jgi:DNA-binding NarL/FixJ family response regulator